jgi:predicted site-specific integrase-resolvase
MPVLGMREAAKAAGVSRQTLYRYAADGKVSATALADGRSCGTSCRPRPAC